MKRALSVTVVLLPLVTGVTVTAAELKPGDKFLWSSYMICWPLERDYRGFKDRPLDRPPMDGTNSRAVDVQNAVEAGIDAFSVDLFIEDKHALPAFQTLVNIVNTRRLPLQLSPMFDGLGTPGVTVDDVVAKVQARFEKFGQEPSLGYNSVTEGAFYCGLMDEVRLSARALRPEEFGPHNPLSGRR